MATLVREPAAAPIVPPRARAFEDVAVVAGPAALAIALCLISLTSRSLWLDEAATVAIAGQHGSALWSAIAHDGGNMLGYYALEHVLIGWFGHGAFVIRLPSVLAAGCAAGAVALLGLRLFDRRVALASGALTAVSLPLVFWGQNARGYAPMVALVAGSFVAFDALLTSGSRRSWIAYVVLTTLAVYASFVAVFALPAQLIALAWLRREAWRRVAVGDGRVRGGVDPAGRAGARARLGSAVLDPASEPQDRGSGDPGADLGRVRAELPADVGGDRADDPHRGAPARRGGPDRAPAGLGAAPGSLVAGRAGRADVAVVARRPVAVHAS